MFVYRIAVGRFVEDLSGTGARLSGGRWNQKGTNIVYAAENRALAALELLVHASLQTLPSDLKIATIRLPQNIKPRNITISELPANWRQYPAPPEVARLGTDWAKSSSSLLLRVPSAIINEEFNILINPQHPDMKKVKIVDVREFKYDDRLLKKDN